MAAIQSLSTEAIIALINAGTWPQQFAIVSGNLTLINTAVVVDVSDASNIAFHLKNTGVAADAVGAYAFEASIDSTNGVDGTWVPTQAARSNDNLIESERPVSSLAGGASNPHAWVASVAGFQWFRIRATVAPTATAIATWSISRSTYGTGVVGFIGTMPVIGTVDATLVGTSTIDGTVDATIIGTASIDGTVVNTPATGNSFQIQSAASNNATVVKASPGVLYEITAYNSSAAIAYLKLYNKATAPAPATDAALLMDIIALPITSGRVNIPYGAIGKRFPAGIGIAIVAGTGNADNTNTVVGITASLTYI